jgi:acetyltransferase
MRALESLLVRFSQLVVENPMIKECDINPLLAGEGTNLVALDARVVLFKSGEEAAVGKRPAIRPYPRQYVERAQMPDGAPVTYRPIRPEDESLMVQFHKSLSESSVRSWYFESRSLNERIDHTRLRRACFIDYANEMALIAIVEQPDGSKVLAGIARMQKSAYAARARFAIAVTDQWQRQGIGSHLLAKLVDVAKAEGLTLLRAAFLPESANLKHLFEKFGFRIVNASPDEPLYAEIDLPAVPGGASLYPAE